MTRNKRITLIILGFAVFLGVYQILPANIFVQRESRYAVATIAWMSFWWITGPVDFAVTAFLPIVLNSVLQITDMSAVIANYASETILLLLASSILTVSWEETNLDQRIAIRFISLIGSKLRQQVMFWFLFSLTLSVFLPNAVVCAAITPIAVTMLKYAGESDIGTSKKASMVLIAIAYGTGVGGLASPLGGAMNLVAIDYLQSLTGEEYLYTSWVIRFLPVMITLIAVNLIYLTSGCGKNESLGSSEQSFQEQYKKLPPMQGNEKIALGLFLFATVMSFSRQLYREYLPGLKPAYIFMICAVASFFIHRPDGSRLMVWKNVQKKVVWDLLFIFAGGLAAGTLINKSGAADAIGLAVSQLGVSSEFIIILTVVTFTTLLSDVTSNTATAAVAIPIVISIIQATGRNPIPYVYIASVGVNMSFMLPTSIRAIPVGYGLQPSFMLKKGAPLTVILIVLVSVLCYGMIRFWPLFSMA